MQMAVPSFNQFMLGEGLVRRFLEQAKAGDADAFERLVSLHERRVLRLAQRLLLNREAAKDAAQEVFLRLYKHLGKMDEERDVGAWLYRTTANVCFDLLRRSKNDLGLDLAVGVSDEGLDPEQTAVGIERKRLVLEALQELAPRERQAIILRDLEGCPTAEVAQIMGSTEATVRSQLSTGRLKIKDFVLARLKGKV
jgi:RNA polymerase sigma-70 factor (ECF subfamily)